MIHNCSTGKNALENLEFLQNLFSLSNLAKRAKNAKKDHMRQRHKIIQIQKEYCNINKYAQFADSDL